MPRSTRDRWAVPGGAISSPWPVLRVVCCSVLVLLALASPALAEGTLANYFFDPSLGLRQDCDSCHGGRPDRFTGEYTTSTPSAPDQYLTWGETGANAETRSPHKGYAEATQKCRVCHAVHLAPASGEMLLPGTVAAACEYCHIDTSVGGVQLYGGNADNYYAMSDDGHNRTGESDCSNCHSTHGADTMGGANAGKVLWDWAANNRSEYSTQVLDVWPSPATLEDDNAQITAWCTGCHAYFTQVYGGSVDARVYDHGEDYDWYLTVVSSHVMTDLAGGYSNRSDVVATGTPVAWVSSEHCRSCHDAGGTDQGPGVHADSFPHFVDGYYGFMTMAESLEGTAWASSDRFMDGLCLKCHRLNESEGVGGSY